MTQETLKLAPITKDMELTATLPHEMVVAQQQLITWCDGKIFVLKKESDELKQSYEHAKTAKWKYTTLQNQYNKSVKKISYYQKIKAALIEGYYIVPNFPIQMFAIRTDRDKPLKVISSNRWENRNQDAQELPETGGDYKNPIPILFKETHEKSDGKTLTTYWNGSWDDVEFPITMAKPQIMDATSKAMALKLFDRIGIMPATKKEDPVIIGQIIHKQGKYNTRIVSFMIAWHLNTNVL